ncbi:PREDICTED: uncharacterized protein LOC105556127, partial [Vollenhovia emeryi]|uniref:uncharacterized protein LOC105556127 n=1 Tax=Vollenhovia emeryi TaxID=411798 RepID=UPI0005F3A670
MVERRIQEVLGQSQKETNQRLQRMEDLIRSLVGGGARNSGPATGPSDPRKGGGGAVRDRPVPGAGSKGAKEPPERTANAVEGGSKRKRKKKAPLSQQTQGVEETGVSLGRDAKSSQPAAGAVTYAAVVARKSKAAWKSAKGVPRAAAPSAPVKGQAGGPPKKTPRRRLPRTSAVVITRPDGDYCEAMARLRREVKLEDLGIGGLVSIRSGATGAKVIEVSGEGHADKADLLAGHITRVFLGEEGTRVDRPRRMAEVRLRDLDDSLDVEEVKGWVAEAVRCGASDMQCGALQPTAGGKHSLWMRLPLTAAREMSLKGRIRVGWGTARVDLLEARPMRCHSCLERGHVRSTCPGEVDRSGRCYRCGETGHVSRDCRSAPKCPLCTDKGRPATHVLGAKTCAQKNANVNHSPHAQELLQQSMMERGFTLAIVSEPHRAPENSPYWAVGLARDSVAIRWRSVPGGPGMTVIERGDRHVAVQWGRIAVVGTYLRPTRRLAPFEDWLSDIGQTLIRLSPRPVLVAGAFNAWHTNWGSRRTNGRGKALARWAAMHGLVLVNEGRNPTCVRTQGESIVDITWATPSAMRLIT